MASDDQIFSWQGLMERLFDDEELCRDVLAAFIEDIPMQWQILEQHYRAGDLQAVQTQAHTIKGAAANITAERLREAAFQVEAAGREDDTERLQSELPLLKRELDLLLETIRSV
jgi:HPt (histidine-containing phosphotransfer) domain-containing protein